MHAPAPHLLVAQERYVRLNRVQHLNAVLKEVRVRWQAHKPRDSDKYAAVSLRGGDAEQLWETAPLWGPKLGLSQGEQELWAALREVRMPAGAGGGSGWGVGYCCSHPGLTAAFLAPTCS